MNEWYFLNSDNCPKRQKNCDFAIWYSRNTAVWESCKEEINLFSKEMLATIPDNICTMEKIYFFKKCISACQGCCCFWKLADFLSMQHFYPFFIKQWSPFSESINFHNVHMFKAERWAQCLVCVDIWVKLMTSLNKLERGFKLLYDTSKQLLAFIFSNPNVLVFCFVVNHGEQKPTDKENHSSLRMKNCPRWYIREVCVGR